MYADRKDYAIDTYIFWVEVFILKNATGKYRFKEVALFVFNELCLPTSNALCERIFSH